MRRGVLVATVPSLCYYIKYTNLWYCEEKTVAETYIMINEIMEEHHIRMQNLRKYYPFFVLNETAFTQYKEGRYADLDMGYITMASLRFFINENQFNERSVPYEQYETFLLELLRRDFNLQAPPSEEQELVTYIFEKLKNDGRPFEFHFFDPEDKKRKTARVKLIEGEIIDGTVSYRITAEGIEFYLDTKEAKDESKISIQQLLLEKMITAKNFRGGIDVVRRINSEVKRLEAQKEAVIEQLSHDIFQGAKACKDYMATVARWFDEEQRLFVKNKTLIEQMLTKISFEGNDRQEASAFYRSLEEINRLETELKKTIHRHGRLITETTRLQDTADQMIHQAKLRSLRNVFDFQDALRKLKQQDDPAGMLYILAPLFAPKLEKFFSLTSVDHMLTYKSGQADAGEPVLREEPHKDFRYEDEQEELRIAYNFGRIFQELLDQLMKKGRIELKEFSAILEIKYGDTFLSNGDYYSFLVHIAQKERYSIQDVFEKPETFLENLITGAWTTEWKERYWKDGFTLEFLEQEEIPIRQGETEFTITNIVFQRITDGKQQTLVG